VASIKVENIKPHIGARIHVDRAQLCDDGVVKQCLELLEQRAVLVFPGLGLTDKEQLAFTDCLGERVDFSRKVPGGDAAEAGVYKVTLDPKINTQPEYVLGTFFWHMDGITADDVPPPKATLLSARSIAPKGGQTEFANTTAAYEGLPDADKTDVDKLRVIHTVLSSIRPILEEGEKWTGAQGVKEHPLVWRKRSGKRSLVIGSHADRVVGMPLAQGRALLARLLEWTAQPDFYYRHQWKEGDFVIWDNCGCLHRVVPYDNASGRTMHRTSIAGKEMVQ
jgi:alpha-ketoglutarate-dependent taurine dioxygenase